MKKNQVRKLFQKKAVKLGGVIAAAVVLAGAGAGIYHYTNSQKVPELVTYVDTDSEVTIQEEEVPLASAPKVSTKTTKKTSQRKVRLKTKSKKTYAKTKKPKSTTRTKTTEKANSTVTVKTVTQVTTTERYKKGSKIKTVITATKKIVTTTTVEKDNTAQVQKNATSISTSAETSTSGNSNTVVNGEIDVFKAAPKLDSRVSNAFSALGFKIYINSGVAYAGVCDTKTRSITLRSANETVYHELGHFLAFIAGNVDKSADFQKVYQQEKGKYTAINKAYATQNSSEYFAESFKEYTLNPVELQKARPNTYNAIVNALSKVTSQQIAKIQSVYGPIWGA